MLELTGSAVQALSNLAPLGPTDQTGCVRTTIFSVFDHLAFRKLFFFRIQKKNVEEIAEVPLFPFYSRILKWKTFNFTLRSSHSIIVCAMSKNLARFPSRMKPMLLGVARVSR